MKKSALDLRQLGTELLQRKQQLLAGEFAAIEQETPGPEPRDREVDVIEI